MSRDGDEDPLSWAGDDDPTLQPGGDIESTTPKPPPASPTSADDGRSHDQAEPRSAMLIALGIFGGIYLLYTVGWAVNIGRDVYTVASPIDQVMYTAGLWLATAAAPLWFATSLWFTRGHARSRILWLVLGALVLIPWPFAIGGL